MAHVMMAPMTLAKAAAAGVAMLTATLALSACSWRMETEPDPFRTPSEVTVLRDRVAAAEQAVGTAAGLASGPLADAESAAVPARLDALAGVSPTSSPRPAADLAAAAAAAQQEALDCMAGAGEDPLAALCASIALSHAAIAGVADPAGARDSVVEGGLVPTADSPIDRATVAQLALEHDKLRSLYEVIAARAEGDERATALLASAGERERVASLLAVPGVEYITEPVYDVPASSVTDQAARAATALEAQRALAERYAALLVAADPADRAWLLNSAYAAYLAAAQRGLTASEVPALPGTEPATAAN